MSSFIHGTPPKRPLKPSLLEVEKHENLSNERLVKLLMQLFKGNFWDKNVKDSVTNTLRKAVNTERIELVELTLFFQNLNGWFPWHTSNMIKILDSIGWLDRKNCVDKILLLTKLYQYSVKDILETAQIIAILPGWDRSETLQAITSRAPANFHLSTVNIFLKLFGGLSKEKRLYFIENKLLEHTMVFINLNYWEEEIEKVIWIIDKIPAQDRDDLMKRILPWLKEEEEAQTRSLVLEQVIFLLPEERKEKLQEKFDPREWILF